MSKIFLQDEVIKNGGIRISVVTLAQDPNGSFRKYLRIALEKSRTPKNVLDFERQVKEAIRYREEISDT